MGRSLNDLRRDQEAILTAHRAERAAAVVMDSRAGAAPVGSSFAFGRVVEVVAADETYGPHLMVVRQAWSGTPPVPADAVAGATRGYPVPGRVVADFAVDDVVRMSYISGAILIERPG